MTASELICAKTRKLAIVADDDDDIRCTLCEILEGEGFVVLEARDGGEALALALRHQPALILLDQRMPQLTGAEVFTALCAQAAPCRAVLMTADPCVATIARAAGIAHYLAKPFDVDALLTLVARALSS